MAANTFAANLTNFPANNDNKSFYGNLSSDLFLPNFAGNWTEVPEGCVMVLLSQLELMMPGNNPDSLVSADERRTINQIKNCFLLLIFLVGLPANVINMAVFFKQGLKDRVTLLLFCQSFSDGVSLAASMVFQAEELYMQFVSSEEVSPYFTFLINNRVLVVLCIYYTSPIFSAIVAVERCLCVFNPLKSKTLMSTRSMALIIASTYVLVYSLAFVSFFRYHIGCLYDPVLRVRIRAALNDDFYRSNRELINVMEGVVFGVGVLCGTMLVVVVSTGLTIIKLRRIKRWRSESSSSSASSSFSARDESLTKMLVGSSIFFVICVTPYGLFNAVRLLFPEVDYGKKEHNLFISFQWLGEQFSLVKPACNVFVYYTMGSRFRETFWALFGRKRGKQRPS